MRILIWKNVIRRDFRKCHITTKGITYVQGQTVEPRTREYFYYIDHQGMLFLDDAKMKNFTSCFKEKKFLEFFFKRIRINDIGRYEDEFPYMSPCGRELNFIRCDDLPIVYTHVVSRNDSKEQWLSYGHAGDLLLEVFQPEKLCMFPESGRIYHPARENVGGVGLIKSSLAIEFSKNFKFENGSEHSTKPSHFVWGGKSYLLTHELVDTLRNTDRV